MSIVLQLPTLDDFGSVLSEDLLPSSEQQQAYKLSNQYLVTDSAPVTALGQPLASSTKGNQDDQPVESKDTTHALSSSNVQVQDAAEHGIANSNTATEFLSAHEDRSRKRNGESGLAPADSLSSGATAAHETAPESAPRASDAGGRQLRHGQLSKYSASTLPHEHQHPAANRDSVATLEAAEENSTLGTHSAASLPVTPTSPLFNIPTPGNTKMDSTAIPQTQPTKTSNDPAAVLGLAEVVSNTNSLSSPSWRVSSSAPDVSNSVLTPRVPSEKLLLTTSDVHSVPIDQDASSFIFSIISASTDSRCGTIAEADFSGVNLFSPPIDISLPDTKFLVRKSRDNGVNISQAEASTLANLPAFGINKREVIRLGSAPLLTTPRAQQSKAARPPAAETSAPKEPKKKMSFKDRIKRYCSAAGFSRRLSRQSNPGIHQAARTGPPRTSHSESALNGF